jgi:hypothetical protein
VARFATKFHRDSTVFVQVKLSDFDQKVKDRGIVELELLQIWSFRRLRQKPATGIFVADASGKSLKELHLRGGFHDG